MIKNPKGCEPGARYGSLIVIEGAAIRTGRSIQVPCACDCGQSRLVYTGALRSGLTTSCGCARKSALTKHGQAGHNRAMETPIYSACSKLRKLCSQGFKRSAHCACHEYDPRWDDFDNFLSDFGEIEYHQTILRKDKKMTWCKDNCYVGLSQKGRYAARPCTANPIDTPP